MTSSVALWMPLLSLLAQRQKDLIDLNAKFPVQPRERPYPISTRTSKSWNWRYRLLVVYGLIGDEESTETLRKEITLELEDDARLVLPCDLPPLKDPKPRAGNNILQRILPMAQKEFDLARGQKDNFARLSGFEDDFFRTQDRARSLNMMLATHEGRIPDKWNTWVSSAELKKHFKIIDSLEYSEINECKKHKICPCQLPATMRR
ncbi:hypothetical protein N7456_010985 [Penicillium angulare]|uniref:Uncharacterized protein n=1 Tax=Penicillium angulare TaxID=116970 RepID=A0A9W9ET41_9EURO|nr:hypothetical protein N7456_010985 [Penicillium angulare]